MDEKIMQRQKAWLSRVEQRAAEVEAQLAEKRLEDALYGRIKGYGRVRLRTRGGPYLPGGLPETNRRRH